MFPPVLGYRRCGVGDHMSTQSADYDRVSHRDDFESWARSLCQFVVRAVLLPVTMFFIKPSALLRSSSSGEHQPLPSPFLLSLIVGLVVYGVLATLLTSMPTDEAGIQDFLNSLFSFYGSLSNIGIILYPLPYILIVWSLGGFISLIMFGGTRAAEIVVTSISFCLSALIALTILLSAAGFGLSGISSPVMMGLAVALGVYGLVLAVKMVRVLLLMRSERNSSLIGVLVGAALSFLIVAVVGVMGAGLSYSFYEQRDYLHARAIAEAAAQGDRLFDEAEYEGAVGAYTRAIDLKAADPVNTERARVEIPDDASLFNSRCRARAVWGQDLEAALTDCDVALALLPEAGNILTSRGLVNFRRGDYQAAYKDYNAAVLASPQNAQALYGRGLTQTRLQQFDAGEQDRADALAIDPNVARFFEGSGGADRRATEIAEQIDPTDATTMAETAEEQRIRNERIAEVVASWSLRTNSCASISSQSRSTGDLSELRRLRLQAVAGACAPDIIQGIDNRLAILDFESPAVPQTLPTSSEVVAAPPAAARPVPTRPIERRLIRALAIGENFNSALDNADSTLESNAAPYELWSFRADGGQPLEISMTSQELDSYLEIGRIRNGQFEELASNDDRGDGTLNSAIRVIPPETGEYIIRARAFWGEQYGTYELSVQPAPAAQAQPPRPTR